MNETVEIQGDTGKVIITGVDIIRHIDLSSIAPNQIYTAPYLVTLQKPWEEKVDFDE